jgi:FMN-dependent NADH-azoreductase
MTVKRLLYISANTKPEDMSSSKTVARMLVNRMLAKAQDMKLEEVDLYKEHIPQLKHAYFASRNALVNEEAKKKLSREEQGEIDQINKLCDQFVSADIYVLAAPMWSLSFPAPVKEYLDCVVQADKTIKFDNNKPHGLLGDRPRFFVYVQSSGGHIPWLIRPALNKGLNYVHDIVRFIGIGIFEELLVDGTGTTEDERQEAIDKAAAKIDVVLGNILL